MFVFVLGLVLIGIGAGAIGVAMIAKKSNDPRFEQNIGGTAAPLAGGVFIIVCGIVATVYSTAIYVNDGEGGLVIKKFGRDLPAGSLVATNGEKGPQAKVLPPGWHFFYWPWLYNLEPTENIQIESGTVGVITAKDGKSLPTGTVYAPEWENVMNMLDAQQFLTSDEGYRGPQLSVLPPGQYRYNPRLFQIVPKEALTVKAGEVVVIKANVGEEWDPPKKAEKTAPKKSEKKPDGSEVAEVTPETDEPVTNLNSSTPDDLKVVPVGYRGIWEKALLPNQYYIHPDAYETIRVKTVNRIYSYTGPSNFSGLDRPEDDNSIEVRTKDGFEFPVDVRASVRITAKDAPYVVARLGDPDADLDGDGFDVLEELVILPAVRTVFRNSAGERGALDYVNSRAEIEEMTTEEFRKELAVKYVETDKLYIADIGLSKTEEGQELLKTQTDREVATQEQETWKQKTLAAQSRAESVRADAEADKEKDKVEAKVQIEIATDEAQAEIERATGKAEAAMKEIEAVGGYENYVLLKAVETIGDQWGGQVPGVIVMGGEGKLDSAVLSRILQQMQASSGSGAGGTGN